MLLILVSVMSADVLLLATDMNLANNCTAITRDHTAV